MTTTTRTRQSITAATPDPGDQGALTERIHARRVQTRPPPMRSRTRAAPENAERVRFAFC
ncbi:MAG: hypothetical protein ACLUI3_13990 [Christensenellales bacterium]